MVRGMGKVMQHLVAINETSYLSVDEAFAGVDDKNISSMYELVNKMDFLKS